MASNNIELEEFLKNRQADKMARSPHAFVRGNTVQHYEWLAAMGANLPDGPPVWICGDCHVGNLGPIADLNGRIDVQIRDLDQTVISNPAHDLIRLALSLASAARGSNLPGTTTADMIEKMFEGYEAGLTVLDEEIQNEDFENLICGSRVTMDELLRKAPENWYLEAKALGLIEAVL